MFSKKMILVFSYFLILCRLDANDTNRQEVFSVIQILEEQPESIENWVGERVYLNPEKIRITHKGAFLCNRQSVVELPKFARDQKGIFLRCTLKEISKEAQDHYDKARDALINGIGHSIGAGLMIECPPASLYEGYQAVQSFKEFGQEYSAGVQCDQTDTIKQD